MNVPVWLCTEENALQYMMTMMCPLVPILLITIGKGRRYTILPPLLSSTHLCQIDENMIAVLTITIKLSLAEKIIAVMIYTYTFGSHGSKFYIFNLH